MIKNEGTTVFDSLQLVDDMIANFGASYMGLISGPTITANAGTPDLPNISGVIFPNLFDGISGELKPDESIKVEFTVELNPNESGNLEMLSNQAESIVTNRYNNEISDLSDDVDDPTGNDDPNIISFPKIGVAKQVTSIPAPDAASGTALSYDVTYQFVIKNIGDVAIEKVSLTDDMASQFGGAMTGVVSPPSIEAATTAASPGGINIGFDGDTDLELLDSLGVLQSGEEIVVSVVVELSPYAAMAIYHPSGYLANQATASGLFDCAWVADLSDEGTDPNDSEAPAGINSGTLGDTGTSNDPTLFPFEICGNGIDDDFDGDTDLEDDECEPDCSFLVTIDGGCSGLEVQLPESDWTFKWFKDAVEIAGAVSDTYVPVPPEAGEYYVEITNTEGCMVESNKIEIENCCEPTKPKILGIE